MADIIIYNTADGKAAIKLYADNGTVWLTQAQIAELFTKNISTISRHIANIFDENEIEEKSNLRFMQIANSDKPVAFIVLMSFLPSVPRAFATRHAVPPMGKQYLKGISAEGLYPRQRPPEKPGWPSGLFRRIAGTDSRHSCQRKTFLSEAA